MHLQSPEHGGWQYDYDAFQSLLAKAKEVLTPRQREIFEMNREDGVEVQEIARRLSIQEQVVRNQLSIATKKIKEYLNYPDNK